MIQVSYPRHDFLINNDMNDFVIDFTFRGAAYKGLVTPYGGDDHAGYGVKLESENQETYLNIVATPCGVGKMDWCFKEEERQVEYDQDLLREIGEAIEKFQAQSS